MSSYYALKLDAEKKNPPHRNVLLILVDVLVSFFGLPILVVWYWRGCWQLQDWYFWGSTVDEHDLLVSLGWSTVLGVLCMIAASEPIMHHVPVEHMEEYSIPIAVIGRLRTMVLAIGAVAFWRVIWNLWDLSGTTHASVWSSEVVSVFCLAAIGCASCITAPPSTLGVDVTPNRNSADEPLLAMLLIPWEILSWWGIVRQPKVVPVEPDPSQVELAEVAPEEEQQEGARPRRRRNYTSRDYL